MRNLSELRDQLMENPEFKAGYEARDRLIKIGRLLKQARKIRDLSQTELAVKVGVAQSEVSRMESGEGVTGPGFETLVNYAHAMGMDVVVELIEKEASGQDMVSIEALGELTAADKESVEVSTTVPVARQRLREVF